MIETILRQLQRKWGEGPVLYRMPPEAYLLYQAELQTLLDTLALAGEEGAELPEGEAQQGMTVFLEGCLRRGDLLTVAEVVPKLRRVRDKGISTGFHELLLQTLLKLGRTKESRWVLEGLSRLPQASDTVRFHWYRAWTALVERNPDPMIPAFETALTKARRSMGDREFLPVVYDAYILALDELSQEGLVEPAALDALLARWAADPDVPQASAEFLLGRALSEIRSGQGERVWEDLTRLRALSPSPTLEARRLLVEIRLFENEGRVPEVCNAFRRAFRNSLESGDPWIERLVMREGMALARSPGGAKTFRELILDLTEEKDWYPERDHSHRVAGLALRMAALDSLGIRLGDPAGDVPPTSPEALGRMAGFHDIGKWLLPWCLLNRTLPLSETERRMFQAHPANGESILESWGEREAARISGEHHCRLHGDGYPEGRLPTSPASSLVALAEAFCGASGATRKYPVPKDAAILLAEFKSLRMIQFEAIAVDALLLAAAQS
jgi:HD-GYP domain-containing protein (c-di-GMP phosphodiesterase class II)